MSDATTTELAPAKPRTPSRTARKRDERVRRVIARLRRDAPWLQAPRYGIQLRAYAILWIRFENLHAANGDALDELGKPHPVNEGLARLAGKLSQLGRELGLSPVAEKALHLDAAAQTNHSKWLALANWKDEEVVPAPSPAQPAVRQSPARRPKQPPTARRGCLASPRPPRSYDGLQCA
jgi:hypothetical protein